MKKVTAEKIERWAKGRWPERSIIVERFRGTWTVTVHDKRTGQTIEITEDRYWAMRKEPMMKVLYYATAKIDGHYPVFPVRRINGRLSEGEPIETHRTWDAAMDATARLNGVTDA